jgi:hypothetical protein
VVVGLLIVFGCVGMIKRGSRWWVELGVVAVPVFALTEPRELLAKGGIAQSGIDYQCAPCGCAKLSKSCHGVGAMIAPMKDVVW